MKPKPHLEQSMQDEQIREALNTHWHASEAGDANAEHGRPAYTVSIMEFRNGKVVHETQYFADPFEAPAWRSQWVQRIA
jgi:hypothetical protein